MGKKSVIMGLCMLGVLGIPMAGLASQTIDAPHVNLDSNAGTEDCSICHFAVNKKTCTDCHNSAAAGGYTDSVAPKVSTHKGFKCQVCHNPHVSLQASGTPLVAGTFTAVNFDSGTQKTTLTTNSFTANDPTFGAPDSWTKKSVKHVDANLNPDAWGTDRGLILWLKDSASTDMYSFEIDGVTAPGGVLSAITVKGEVPAGIAFDGNYKLFYGQLISTMVSPVNTDFRDGTSPVVFNNPKGFANGSIPNGICQVCHTTTQHWRADGTLGGHNENRSCTGCHKHEAVDTLNPVVNGLPNGGFGLGQDCIICHTAYPAPPQTGMHELHAGTSGYAFACSVCHKAGMNASDVTRDNKLEIGFNLIPLTTASNAGPNYNGVNTNYDGVAGTLNHFPGVTDYQGGNGTTVTTGGTKSCSNVYCHSNGYANGVLKCTTSPANTSPAWDSNRTNSCTICHDNSTVPAGFAPYQTGTWGSQPNYNTHWAHIQAGIKCGNCHADTMGLTNNTSIATKANHVNGTVNIKGAGDYGGPVAINFNATNNTCTNSCHTSRTWVTYNVSPNTNAADNVTCPTVTATANVDPVWSATCYNVDNQTFVLDDMSTDVDYADAIKHGAYGGHTPSDAAWWKINWDNAGGNDLRSVVIADTPVSNKFSRAFTQSYLTGKGTTPVSVIYRLSDNDARSYNSMVNGGGGTPPAGSGWVKTAWIACDRVVFDDNALTTNIIPALDFTSSTVNSTTLRVTDHSVDPDWNTTPSNPNWQGVNKNAVNGCGNDGSAAKIKFLWNDTPDVNGVQPSSVLNTVITDTPVDHAFDHTFDAAYRPGGVVWYQYKIWDNTFQKCGAASGAQYSTSGWRTHTLQ